MIAVAMIATILIGTIASGLLPTLLRHLNMNAVAGGVVLTTITTWQVFLSFWASPVGHIQSRQLTVLHSCAVLTGRQRSWFL